MNIHNQNLLLSIIIGVVALTIAMLRERGMKVRLNVDLHSNRGGASPTGVQRTVTRVQTKVKLIRHTGSMAGFPKLYVMSSASGESKIERVEVKAVCDDGREANTDAGVAAGTPIAPEPGTEIDLADAFRKIAGELCGPFASKTRVKYRVSIQESILGQAIPVEIPDGAANLWPDGLEDIKES